jgi:hypothetical protein
MVCDMPFYFDDIEFLSNRKFAGELLAIYEFNKNNTEVKIDEWYGVKAGRPFPERPFLERFYLAHDLKARLSTTLDGGTVMLPIRS